MRRRNRQRDKKKFGYGRSERRVAGTSVKIKPKEEEPCHTRHRKPKVHTPPA